MYCLLRTILPSTVNVLLCTDMYCQHIANTATASIAYFITKLPQYMSKEMYTDCHNGWPLVYACSFDDE